LRFSIIQITELKLDTTLRKRLHVKSCLHILSHSLSTFSCATKQNLHRMPKPCRNTKTFKVKTSTSENHTMTSVPESGLIDGICLLPH